MGEPRLAALGWLSFLPVVGSLKTGGGQDDVFPCPQHLCSRRGPAAPLWGDSHVDKVLGSGQDPQPTSEWLAVLLPHCQTKATISPLSSVLGRGYLRTSLGVSIPQVLGRGEKESLQFPRTQAQLGVKKERSFKAGMSLQFPGLDFA